jgi:hypothetical protein
MQWMGSFPTGIPHPALCATFPEGEGFINKKMNGRSEERPLMH